MNRSKPQKLAVPEPGNHAEYALLVTGPKTSLKAYDVPHTRAAVFLTQLDNRVGLTRRTRIAKPDRFERPESERIASAPRHLLDRHAALEVRHRVEFVCAVLIRREQRVDEVRVLMAI